MFNFDPNKVSEKFLIEVSKGNVPGHSIIHKYGGNEALSTTIAPICNGGFYRTPPPSSTVTLEAVSTDANDAIRCPSDWPGSLINIGTRIPFSYTYVLRPRNPFSQRSDCL